MCRHPAPAFFLMIFLGLVGCGGGAGTQSAPTAVAPSILVEPSNQSAVSGDAAAFDVSASGTAPLHYQWFENGAPIEGATEAHFAIPSVRISENDALFTVTVRNDEGVEHSRGARLSVLLPEAPSLLMQPSDQTVVCPDPATFSVVAGGVPAPSIQWFRNGAAIAGATGASYTTPPTAPSDDGSLYSVTLTNEAGVLHGAAARLQAHAATATLDLSLDGLYFTQGVQSYRGGVPLVKGRGAYLRVFVKASKANTAAPRVRVKLFNGDALAMTYDLSAPTSSVPTDIDEGSLGSSWNLAIPGALIQPGLGVLAEVDPAGMVAETTKANNLWPRSGRPDPVAVKAAATFSVTLIPVRQNGLTGNVTAANLDRYLDFARKVYPLQDVDVKLGSTFATSTVVDNAGNGMGELLAEIEFKRVLEGMSQRHYYGVYRLPNYDTYASSGRGYIAAAGSTSGRSAIGHDLEGSVIGRNYPEVFAHEIGHNFGRSHAPGCGAADTDAAYPYGAEGHIGIYGLDLGSLTLMPPASTTDVMGYCTQSLWVSDYVYRKVLDFRASSLVGLAAPVQPEPCLIVWGVERGGRWEFEPCFQATTLPVLGDPGSYRLSLEDAEGRSLLELPVHPLPVGDSEEGDAHLVLAIPLKGLSAGALRGLSLKAGGQELARVRAAAAAPARESSQERGCRFLPDGQVRLSWNAATHPMALLRDAESGEVLGLFRGGEAQLGTQAQRLELILSNGITSRSEVYSRPAAMPR